MSTFRVDFHNNPPDLDPSPEKYRDFFLNYDPIVWQRGGGIFLFVDDNGNQKRLTLFENPKNGFWIRYEDLATQDEMFFSLGDSGALTEYVEAEEADVFTLKGLYVPPNTAWKAVEDFLLYNGKRSERISWIKETDIPEGMEWLISKDCL